jgi:hypothetical protein
MGVGAAIAGAAVVGAASSRNASKKAANASRDASNTASAETRRAADEARADIFKLFPASQDALATGYQGAANIFGQTAPQQADIFQQGNVAAQQQIAAGMPQFQNAILGGQVDYNQFQPTQLQQPDFSFMQGQQFESPDPFDPNYGMTDEQIQNATAQNPASPYPTNLPPVGTIYRPQNNQANMLGGGFGRKNLMRYR